MRTISQTNQFKKDYKREAKGQHRAALDADVLAVLSLLAADQTLCKSARLRQSATHVYAGKLSGALGCA